MKKIFIMSILTMLSSLSSCQAQNKGYKSLSADDYEKAIADTAVIRLDVRTAEEFANGHIVARFGEFLQRVDDAVEHHEIEDDGRTDEFYVKTTESPK